MSDSGKKGRGNSDRTGIFKDDRTQISSKKLQVQMPSGKIYGPYTRIEILSFIASKKIRGEEKILFEGDTVWRPIATDTEFYDAIHTVLMGGSITRLEDELPTAAASKSSKRSRTQEDDPSRDEATAVQSSGTRTEYISPDKNSEKTQVIDPVKEKIAKSITEDGPVPGLVKEDPSGRNQVRPQSQVPDASGETVQSVDEEESQTKKKFNPRILILLLGLVVVAGLFLPQEQKNKKAVGRLNEIRSAQNYARTLVVRLQDMNISQIRLPKPLGLAPAPSGQSPEFILNGERLIDRIELRLEAQDSDEAKQSHFWVQLASDLQLLGIRVQVVSLAQGREIEQKGIELQRALEAQSLLLPEEKALIEGYRAHSLGDWQKLSELAQSNEGPIWTWLVSDGKWWASFSDQKEYPLERAQLLGRDAELDVSMRVRQTYRARDASVVQWLQQLANIEATSPLLWLTSAELSWRQSQNVQVQSTYRDFMIGLGALVLYPPSIQLAYWNEFATFLGSYARTETQNRALQNLDLLSKGNIGFLPPGQWWDLEEEGLKVREVAQSILDKSRQRLLNDRDRAALYVLGSSLQSGEAFLSVMGIHLVFEESLSDAEHIFEQMLDMNAQSETAYFGLVWVLAKQFRFLEAENVYKEMLQNVKEAPHYQRISGILHYLARDYSEAFRLLRASLQIRPNDAWAHFFIAKAHLDRKRYYECAKAANLGALHARGELLLQVESLLYECRVLGGIGVSKAIEELAEKVRLNPDNVGVRVLLVKMLHHADLYTDALERMNAALKRFPFNFQVHIAAGDLLFKRSEYRQALEYYTSASRLAPGSARPWIKIAEVLERQERYEDAGRNYVTAANAQPDFPEIYLFAARAFDKARRVSLAAKYYKKEIEVRPSGMGPFIEATEFLLRNNAPQQVPELYRQFKGGYENDPRALIRLAQAYNIMNEFPEAKKYASLAVAQSPNDAKMHLLLANILDRSGDYALAKRYYLKYLDLAPAAPDRGNLMDKLGKPPYAN